MSKSANAKMRGIERRITKKEVKNTNRFENQRRGQPGTARLKELSAKNQSIENVEVKEHVVALPEQKKNGILNKIKSLWGRK